MPDITLEGNAVEEIFEEAIAMIPFGGAAVAHMIKTAPRRFGGKPLTNQQAFQKATQKMQHLVGGKEDALVKHATSNYLSRKYGFPASEQSAYDLKAKRDKIVLSHNPENPRNIQFQWWANKHNFDNVTLNGTPDKEYTQLSKEDVSQKLSENKEWLEKKQILATRAKEIFNASDESIERLFSGLQATRAQFDGCEIHSQDFSGHDISGASFKGAKLVDCTFKTVHGADFSGAVIENCNFSRADVAYSTFENAEIRNTTFEGAQLEGVNFSKAIPSEVNLNGASLKNANIDFVDSQRVQLNVPAKGVEQAAPAAVSAAAPAVGAVSKVVGIAADAGKSVMEQMIAGIDATQGQARSPVAAAPRQGGAQRTPQQPATPMQPRQPVAAGQAPAPRTHARDYTISP